MWKKILVFTSGSYNYATKFCLSMGLFLLHYGVYKLGEIFHDNRKSVSMCLCKGQCHEIFHHFFCLKDSTWAPHSFREYLCEKTNFAKPFLPVHMRP